MGNVFVGADWSQLETWLTAHFSGDETLQGELDAQLAGGHKIHALNAAMMYGIDPGDAKSHMVKLQGRDRPAYDAGKRIGHLWNYGGEDGMIAQTFWLEREFAKEIYEKLNAKYVGVVAWRERMADEVFGVARVMCPRCGDVGRERAPCVKCSSRRYTVMRVWDGWETPPTREMRTPFGRRRLYMGQRKQGMKALASQLPQSCGASMWYRTLQRLNGFEVVDGVRYKWPKPDNVTVRTGTYDSFIVECADGDAAICQTALWLAWTMEVAWSQLGGRRFPCELEWGSNWGAWDKDVNPQGLREILYTPLSATRYEVREAGGVRVTVEG